MFISDGLSELKTISIKWDKTDAYFKFKSMKREKRKQKENTYDK